MAQTTTGAAFEALHPRSTDGTFATKDVAEPADGLAAVAERVAAAPYPNPGPTDAAAVEAVLRAAW